MPEPGDLPDRRCQEPVVTTPELASLPQGKVAEVSLRKTEPVHFRGSGVASPRPSLPIGYAGCSGR